MLGLALAALSLVSPGGQDPSPSAPVLAQADFVAWRRHLMPAVDELSWETIPWRASFADGLADAARARKPLLLWVMNGHPLGCT